MYQFHPSEELTRLFVRSPYQGVEPAKATFLFIGLDANYAPGIEAQPIFAKVVEYHSDGVSFWREHGVHHPFLLPDYSGDGHFYHRTFARIGFTSSHASLVSFVELLHRPTVGRSDLAPEDLEPAHLEMVNAAILHGPRATSSFRPASPG
jgi:hypothetical protein